MVQRECACGGNCFGGGYTDGLGAGSPRKLVIGSPCLNPNNQGDVGFVVHEIMHALGFIHTQTRPDRDEKIRVNSQNIVGNQNTHYQYAKCSNCQTTNTIYDCSSVMHYQAYFNTRPGSCTGPTSSGCAMTALNPSTCDLFGPKNVMTKTDIDVMNNIYQCSNKVGKSCKGVCGQKSSDGCFCDELCEKYGDCCPDKAEVCSPLTCRNNCGKKVSANGKTCYCDSSCRSYNDCCDDISSYC